MQKHSARWRHGPAPAEAVAALISEWTRSYAESFQRFVPHLGDWLYGAKSDWFSNRCDNQPTCLMLVKVGLGIGFVQIRIAQKDPTLEQLFPNYELPTLDVSLAAHEKMLRVPRVRAVWERLEIGLRPALL